MPPPTQSAFLEGARGNRFGERRPPFCQRRSKPISLCLLLPNRLSRRGRGGTALVSVASFCQRRSKPISLCLLLPNRLSWRGRGGTALVSVAPLLSAEKQDDFFMPPPTQSAFLRGRGGTALVSVAPPFVSGEASRFLYASSYPIGFLGGGAGEPLFGQQRAVPPHIIFILALTPPRFRAGVFLRPSRRGGGASRRHGSAAAVSAPRADRRWPGPRPGKGRRRFRRLGR